MKTTDFKLIRYDADDGCTFDWKEPRYIELEDGTKEEQHLNAKTLFISVNDSITNYVEVAADGTRRILEEPELADENDYVAALAEMGVEV